MLAALNMGGYGIYVWPAYAATIVVFFINVILFFHEKKSVQKHIKSDHSS